MGRKKQPAESQPEVGMEANEGPFVPTAEQQLDSPAVEPERRGAAIELLVAFSNVNVGDKTGSIGITIDRADFSINQADEILCGHRVTATIIGRPPGNSADQGNLPMLADDVVLSTTFDIKAFRTTPKVIGCSLVCNLGDVDVKQLATFAKRNGKFIINGVGDIPANAPKAPKPAPCEDEPDEFESPE